MRGIIVTDSKGGWQAISERELAWPRRPSDTRIALKKTRFLVFERDHCGEICSRAWWFFRLRRTFRGKDAT